jgi:hypothetical protein
MFKGGFAMNWKKIRYVYDYLVLYGMTFKFMLVSVLSCVNNFIFNHFTGSDEDLGGDFVSLATVFFEKAALNLVKKNQAFMIRILDKNNEQLLYLRNSPLFLEAYEEESCN